MYELGNEITPINAKIKKNKKYGIWNPKKQKSLIPYIFDPNSVYRTFN